MSYAAKHNHANGEHNRDGSDYNLSANYGVEGPSDDPGVQATRLRQSKNLLATLFLSLGTPLLLGGDELARTQHGNNNAYCHDSELSWFDWTPSERGAELSRFCRALAALRAAHPALQRDAFYAETAPRDAGVRWFAPGGGAPDWDRREACLGACLGSAAGDLYLVLNAAAEREFAIPAAPHGGAWRRVIDTALPPPDDITAPDRGLLITPQETYAADARSLVLLAAPSAPDR